MIRIWFFFLIKRIWLLYNMTERNLGQLTNTFQLQHVVLQKLIKLNQSFNVKRKNRAAKLIKVPGRFQTWEFGPIYSENVRLLSFSPVLYSTINIETPSCCPFHLSHILPPNICLQEDSVLMIPIIIRVQIKQSLCWFLSKIHVFSESGKHLTWHHIHWQLAYRASA